MDNSPTARPQARGGFEKLWEFWLLVTVRTREKTPGLYSSRASSGSGQPFPTGPWERWVAKNDCKNHLKNHTSMCCGIHSPGNKYNQKKERKKKVSIWDLAMTVFCSHQCRPPRQHIKGILLSFSVKFTLHLLEGQGVLDQTAENWEHEDSALSQDRNRDFGVSRRKQTIRSDGFFINRTLIKLFNLWKTQCHH